jgi:hypothetical protein
MLLTILSCVMVVFSTPTSLLWSATLLCQFIRCSSTSLESVASSCTSHIAGQDTYKERQKKNYI